MKTPIALQLLSEEHAVELEILRNWNRQEKSDNEIIESINNRMRQRHSTRVQELESEIKFLKSINPNNNNEYKHTSSAERTGLNASSAK